MAKRGRKSILETNPDILKNLIAHIESGMTDEMAYGLEGISHETFYQWVKKNPEFHEAVLRARATANTKAVTAFAGGFERQKVNRVDIQEFEETRLNRKGEPYTYKKVTSTKQVIENPPDWRAGEAWLKRRDALNWSDRLMVEFNPKQLETFAALLKQHGLNASDVFERMIKRLAHADS